MNDASQTLTAPPQAKHPLGPEVAEKVRRRVEELKRRKRRAITLAGGGPTVGLSIGALRRLAREPELDFDVWALSCIGAWLGIVYHQADGDATIRALPTVERRLAQVKVCEDFFRRVFRPDDVYDLYPTATVFPVDFQRLGKAWLDYGLDRRTYQHLVLPDKIAEAAEQVLRFATRPDQWTSGNLSRLLHNRVFALHPLSRFLFGMGWKSPFIGWAALNDPQGSLLRGIDFEVLKDEHKPFIYHNAYNFRKADLDLFSNRMPAGKPAREHYIAGISAATLCACSALPYVEEPVTIGDETYCEGALVDTVNFRRLVADHKLDEVWVSRIVHYKQIHRPENLTDALNNLVQLFAATVSEDDVKLFKFHLAELEGPKPKVYEIEVEIDAERGAFDWSWGNLDRSMPRGECGAENAIRANNHDVENEARDELGLPLLPDPAMVQGDR